MGLDQNSTEIGKILISEEKLKKRVAELAKVLSNDYKDKNPVIITVLKGAVYFLTDLTREMDISLNIDFLSIGSYENSPQKTGIVRITKDLDISIVGRHVILVEEIIGTGLTHAYLFQHLESLKPESLEICCLLNNEDKRLLDIPLKYVGFNIPNEYVIGYGLDYKEQYRNLPYIAILKKLN